MEPARLFRIVRRRQIAGNTLTEKIDQHVVISHAPLLVGHNAFENSQQFRGLNHQPGFLVREAREETGLMIEPAELLGVFERIVPDEQGRMRYHYVLIDFLCQRVSGDLAAADDAEEARWFHREELVDLELARETEEVILKGFEKAADSR